jgi:hypothetical protein
VKSIKTLIRVKQRELDALKRQQNLLEKRREEYYMAIIQLGDRLVQEMKAAKEMPEMAHFFGDFSASIKKRQDQIYVQIRKLDKELDKLAEQIGEKFSELKKFEIAHAAWLKRELDKQRHREQLEMDEVGLRGYLRKDAT